MASSKPQVSSSSDEECMVQVIDSSEPLVPSTSRVQVFDSDEPLALSAGDGGVVQVIDSSEPLVPSTSRVQVLDSDEPLALSGSAPVDPNEQRSNSPVAGPSRRSDTGPPSLDSQSDSDSDEEFFPPPSGSSGRRKHYTSDELRNLWCWKRFYRLLGTAALCIAFAEERGLIPTEKKCTYHDRPMKFTGGDCEGAGHLGKFRCRKSNCRNKSISRAAGTWFENVKIPITAVFQIMFAYCEQMTYNQVRKEVAEDGGPAISPNTVADWYNYCREAVVVYELEHTDAEGKIGGPNKIVQIDESKFGKRKYNRGRQIEGHWVIGMIEDNSDDLRLEVCPDNQRTAEVLMPLIQTHVAAGSIIHTDYWRAYLSLPNYDYIHKRVNHSDPEHRFIAEDGTHTQRIESQWRNLKKLFRQKQNKKDFTDWLIETSWRRKIEMRHGDPFEELIKVIKYVYPIPE